MIAPRGRVPLLADSGPLLRFSKEGPDASRENAHAPRARTASVEVQAWHVSDRARRGRCQERQV